MTSVVDICNRALLDIGARAKIQALTEPSKEAQACSTLFQPTFQNLARAAYWNCLRKQSGLSLLAAAIGTPANPTGVTYPLPPQPFLYSYAQPSDSLAIRCLLPTFPNPNTVVPLTPVSPVQQPWLNNNPQQMFRVALTVDAGNNPQNVILTDLPNAQCVYTADQENPQFWDSQFQAALVASLAAFLVPALTLNMEIAKMQIGKAEAMIKQARAADGNEGPISDNRNASWMQARINLAGGCWWNGGGTGLGNGMYGGFSDMCWPAGI